MFFNPFTLNARIKWLESGREEAEKLVSEFKKLGMCSYIIGRKVRVECVETWSGLTMSHYELLNLKEAALLLDKKKAKKLDECTKKGKCK